MSDFATLWTIAHQSSLSVGFSRQEYWSGLPFCSPWDLLCYRVQACSACCIIGQWTWEMRCWGKQETLIREPADQEDGRLGLQNSHLIEVWMPDRLIDQKERSNEELKSKGRIEREMQWGSKVKGSSVLRNISKGMSSLQKGRAHLFYSQVGRDKLSL